MYINDVLLIQSPSHDEQHCGLLPGGFVDDTPFGPPPGPKKKKTCRKHDETKEFMGIIWVYMGLYGFIWDDHGFIFNGLTTFMGKSTHRKPSIFP